MAVKIGQQPNKLVDQLIYDLSVSICETHNDLRHASAELILRKDFKDKFSDEFSRLKENTLHRMRTGNDTQDVRVNTILSLRHLSRALRRSEYPEDFTLILSSFFFFIDAYSQKKVKEVAEQL